MKVHLGLLATLILSGLIGCSAGRQTNSNAVTPGTGTNAGTTEAVSGEGKFIGQIRMAKDDGSGLPQDRATNVFGEADQIIHCVAMLKEPKAGTRVRFSWWIVEAEGANNEKITDVDYTTGAGDSAARSHVLVPQDWPIGKYKVDVYVNGELDRTIPFSVE